jgi:hypothetical protein
MVAFAILAVGMAGVGTLLLTSMRSDRYSVQMRDGDFLALEKIEELKAQAADTDILSNYGSEYQHHDDRRFSYKWQISKVPTPSDMYPLSRIDITVGWGGENCKGNPDDCTFRTRITNFFIQSGP